MHFTGTKSSPWILLLLTQKTTKHTWRLYCEFPLNTTSEYDQEQLIGCWSLTQPFYVHSQAHMQSQVAQLLGIEGFLVRNSPPAESLGCVLEQDTLSAA